MNKLNVFTELLEWLASICLYPNMKSWNILNVIFFMTMVTYGFLFLRKKFGLVHGIMLAILIAFAWTSVTDELAQVLRFVRINNRFMVTRPFPVMSIVAHWINRWSWRLFIGYFTYKYVKHLGILDMMTFKISNILSLVFVIYVVAVYGLMFDLNGFRTWWVTGYPLWFVYLFGDIVVWMIRITSYCVAWRR